jgi:hypothetical protein
VVDQLEHLVPAAEARQRPRGRRHHPRILVLGHLGALEAKHGRSFGRDADAWAEFLKEGGS